MHSQTRQKKSNTLPNPDRMRQANSNARRNSNVQSSLTYCNSSTPSQINFDIRASYDAMHKRKKSQTNRNSLQSVLHCYSSELAAHEPGSNIYQKRKTNINQTPLIKAFLNGSSLGSRGSRFLLLFFFLQLDELAACRGRPRP